VKKMLSEKNELVTRVAILERDKELTSLSIMYGEFDRDEVIAMRDQHPSLSYEDAYLLIRGKKAAADQQLPLQRTSII